jgi:signal transduction histidine kinase
MKVATRITVATAVVVALASAAYAYFDLRARLDERRAATEREARALVATVRLAIETQVARESQEVDRLRREVEALDQKIKESTENPQALDDDRRNIPGRLAQLVQDKHDLDGRLAQARIALARVPNDAFVQSLAKGTGWQITVFPRARAVERPGPTMSERQLMHLKTMLDVTTTFADVDNGMYFVGVPILEDRSARGMLEVAHSTDAFTVSSNDLARAAMLVVLIVMVTTIVVGVLASRLVTRPITKLLSGIDDVAKGDLSHVILSERDDEIGTIATRFNEMTFSLRESRGETERQNEAKLALEQRLGHTEKLATIGQLAAEIAHEVGTPLNVIAGRARSIQRKAKDPDAVEKNAVIIAEQTARITRIIQRLLDFARRKVGHIERTNVNLNELCLTTMELLAGQFSNAKIKNRLDRADALPRVAGDADRLQQVLINLLLNAIQAMPDGGTLTLETAVVRRARPGLEDGQQQDFVVVSVRDTGRGIAAAIKDKIFDPFYTTKESDGGTGLGLAVCSGIVKEHDGWIDVDDAPGGGTIFRVYVPSDQASASRDMKAQ